MNVCAGEKVAVDSICQQFPSGSMHNTYCVSTAYTVLKKPECFHGSWDQVADYYHAISPVRHDQHPVEVSVRNALKQFWNGKCKYKDIYDDFFAVVRGNNLYIPNKFKSLVQSLFPDAEVPHIDSLLVPGAGPFYEFPATISLFKPSSLLAIDPLENSRLRTSGFMKDPVFAIAKKTLEKYEYLTGYIGPNCIICKDRPTSRIFLDALYDGVLFLHPGPVIDEYEQFPKVWESVFEESLEALQPGGYAIFITYAHRENWMIRNYLNNKPGYETPYVVCGTGEFFLEREDNEARIYSCGLRVQKSLIQPNPQSNPRPDL